MAHLLDPEARLPRYHALLVERDGSVVWATLSWHEQLGLEASETIPSISGLVAAADRHRLLIALERCAAGAASIDDLRLPLLTPHSEEPVWLSWTGARRLDGRVEFLVRDVTRDVRHGQRLEARARSLDLVDAWAQIGHFALDLAEDRPRWSSTLYQIHGLDPGKDPPKTDDLSQLWHPDETERVQAMLGRALSTGEPYTFEARIVRLDTGVVRLVGVRGDAILDEDGNVTGLYGIVQDLTERRSQDVALHGLQQRVDVALDATFAAHWNWDLVSDEIRWSRPWFELTDTDQSAGPSALFVDRIHPDDRDRVRRAIAAHLADDSRPFSEEFRLRSTAGERPWLWVRAVAQAMRGADGKPTRLLGALLDVSATHEAVSHLQAQILQTRSADRAKREFMANMSHEIRTPMNAIMGHAELLSLAELPPAHKQAVQELSDASRALLSLLDDLLLLADASAGRVQLQPSSFDLREAIDDVARLHAPFARDKGLDLQTQTAGIEQGATAVVGDERRIKQMMATLVGNALKFTDQGYVRLAASAIRDPHRVRVRIEVSDTGPGMSPEALDRLFQPFEKADASLTRETGGAGLGLAICDRLVHAMDGSIQVHSEPGRGSRFLVTLTLPSAPAELTDRSKVGAVARPDGRAVRVLLVEDNPVNQRIARAMLSRLGCDIVVAADGAQAVDKAHQADVDIVFMDIQMPVMDGLAAARALRGAGFSKPIIGLTAHARPEDAQACARAGMQAHLTKPVSLDDLRDALGAHLDSL